MHVHSDYVGSGSWLTWTILITLFLMKFFVDLDIFDRTYLTLSDFTWDFFTSVKLDMVRFGEDIIAGVNGVRFVVEDKFNDGHYGHGFNWR